MINWFNKISDKVTAWYFDKVICRKLPKEKGYKWVRATRGVNNDRA